jgi:hypothetical protein
MRRAPTFGLEGSTWDSAPGSMPQPSTKSYGRSAGPAPATPGSHGSERARSSTVAAPDRRCDRGRKTRRHPRSSTTHPRVRQRRERAALDYREPALLRLRRSKGDPESGRPGGCTSTPSRAASRDQKRPRERPRSRRSLGAVKTAHLFVMNPRRSEYPAKSPTTLATSRPSIRFALSCPRRSKVQRRGR